MNSDKPKDVRVSRELLRRVSSTELGMSERKDRIRAKDEVRALLAQPADQQGEPVAWQIRSKTDRPGSQWTPWRECSDYEKAVHSCEAGVFNRHGIMRELRALYAQPATAKVDERAEFEKWQCHSDQGPQTDPVWMDYSSVSNAYGILSIQANWIGWQARAKLNGGQS